MERRCIGESLLMPNIRTLNEIAKNSQVQNKELTGTYLLTIDTPTEKATQKIMIKR